MIKMIINNFKNLDDKVKNIMIKGFKFSFAFCILSTLVLGIYNFYMLPILYTCGLILFKTSLMFFVDFIIIGFGFDKIKKKWHKKSSLISCLFMLRNIFLNIG